MLNALGSFCQGVFLGLILVGAALAALYLAGDPGMPGLNIHQDFYIGLPTPTPTPDPEDEWVPPPTPTPGVGPDGRIPGFRDPHTFREKLHFETRIGRIK